MPDSYNEVVVYHLRENIEIRVPYTGPAGITPARLASHTKRDLQMARDFIDVVDYEGDHIIIPVRSILYVWFERPILP